MTRVLGPQRLQAYADMLQDLPPDPASDEFDELPGDADEQTRREIAERMAPYVRQLYTAHPGLRAPHTDAPRGAGFVQRTVTTAMKELYNPAQIDVMQRIEKLVGRDEYPDPG